MRRVAVFTFALLLCSAASAAAGPPYQTDDPDPTAYGNWEIYVGSTYAHDADGAYVTNAPFVEFNYGALPNVQVSATTQLANGREAGGAAHYAIGDSELAVKLRFVQEGPSRPQVAFYPAVLFPVAGTGSMRLFLPLWLQKSTGPWTVFGGGGLWHEGGFSPHSWTFAGVAAERDISAATSVGAEIFRDGDPRGGAAGHPSFSVGLSSTLPGRRGVLFSIGRAIRGDNELSAYAAYKLNLGPEPAK